jgi:hypothetical protein
LCRSVFPARGDIWGFRGRGEVGEKPFEPDQCDRHIVSGERRYGEHPLGEFSPIRERDAGIAQGPMRVLQPRGEHRVTRRTRLGTT